MFDLKINNEILQTEIFELFKLQLQKDFQNSGLESDFALTLPPVLDVISETIKLQIEPLFNQSSGLSRLLYRIDISEIQLKKYSLENKDLNFIDVVTELIVKRVLQKVILKKNFSK